MLRRYFIFVLVGAAALAANRSHGPSAAAAQMGDGAYVDIAAATATERIRETSGRLGAHLAGPIVRSMSRHTLEMLELLEPTIRRASPVVAKEARALSRQVLRADSLAHAHIEAGQPIEAIRMAMHSKDLIPAVRQTVVEETAFGR